MKKQSLALCIGIHNLGDYQLLHEKCILQAVSYYVPNVRIVHGSYIVHQDQQEGLRIIYLELEKDLGASFSLEEKKKLSSALQQALEASIEEVVPSILMIRNEEEILKNIMTLREEIRSMDDFPQVIVSLEGYSTTHLMFVVTMVWIVEQIGRPLPELLTTIEESWKFFPDRQKILSQDGDEFTKEAHVFRLHLKKSPEFLRQDASVNLHQAHQTVVNFLEKKLGKIRDYTGGIIVLQNALFAEFRKQYQSCLEPYPNFLDDFFYSLTPVDKVITLPFDSLKPLFDAMLDLVNNGFDVAENYVAKKKEVGKFIYLSIRVPSSLAEDVERRIKEDISLCTNLIDTKIRLKGFSFLGYIFSSDHAEERVAFSRHVKKKLGILRFGKGKSTGPKSTLGCLSRIARPPPLDAFGNKPNFETAV